MDTLNAALVVVGGLVLLLGFFSAYIKNRSVLSLPLLALLLGLLLGPGLNVLDPAEWGHQETILEEAARLTLAIGLMAVALRLPRAYLKRHWRALLVLLGLVMPLMWIASGLLTYLLLDVPILLALLIGAVITPTDPVVASSLVSGEAAKDTLPDDDRHLLSAESGINDGLAYLLVLLPILLLLNSTGTALEHWLSMTLVREIIGGVMVGIAAGYGAGRLLEWCEHRRLIEQPSFLSTTIALALLVLGGAKLLGTNGVLAVFVAGIAFDQVVGGGERAQEHKVQESVNQFFSLPIFTLFGLMAPVQEWLDLGWPLLVLGLGVLLFRRLPFVFLARRALPQLPRRRDLLFLGWFGPVGVSAMFYAMLALRKTQEPVVWVVSSLVILASIVAHGLSATPFVKWYGRQTAAQEGVQSPRH
ncbi:cation:proton antiporter [Deinococcus peraridilitoris]|nr:cation:proton antiporter [Deinococcus peraridilitoris]